MNTIWLWLWAYAASFTAIMMALRAQRWMNRWYEQGAQLAQALDKVAYLREALEDRSQWAHTQDYGAAGHRADVEMPLVQPGTTPGVVPPRGPYLWGHTVKEQPVSGLSAAGGLGAPGPPQEGGRIQGAAGDDLKVVGTVSGKVRPLRPPAEPDELPY